MSKDVAHFMLPTSDVVVDLYTSRGFNSSYAGLNF